MYSFQLPFDPALQVVELALSTLTPEIGQRLDVHRFMGYILEEVCVKIWDREATSATAMAGAYLAQIGMTPEAGLRLALDTLDATLSVILSYFPNLTFQQLAAARYTLEATNPTLLWIHFEYDPARY